MAWKHETRRLIYNQCLPLLLTATFKLLPDKLAYHTSFEASTSILENFISTPADSNVRVLLLHSLGNSGSLVMFEGA